MDNKACIITEVVFQPCGNIVDYVMAIEQTGSQTYAGRRFTKHMIIEKFDTGFEVITDERTVVGSFIRSAKVIVTPPIDGVRYLKTEFTDDGTPKDNFGEHLRR